MLIGLLPLMLAAADPEVARVVASVATSQGDLKASAIKSYAAGCRGKSKFSFRKNMDALEALRPVFRDEDPGVRMAALELTSCYDPDTFEGEILYLLNDRDDAVRERAYEEAAHAATMEVMITVTGQVEECAGRKMDMTDVQVKWCVFALYALGECAQKQKDADVRKRVADLTAPLASSPNPRIREHVLRNLEIAGGPEHAAALDDMMRVASTKGSEVKRIETVQKKLRKARKK
jgi:hypothetical protein